MVCSNNTGAVNRDLAFSDQRSCFWPVTLQALRNALATVVMLELRSGAWLLLQVRCLW